MTTVTQMVETCKAGAAWSLYVGTQLYVTGLTTDEGTALLVALALAAPGEVLIRFTSPR